jgi:uncharacterized protein YdiU (UPF0061 family)
MFDPKYQPWTGGGAHFSFLNQPQAAERNFHMFYTALKPLIESNPDTINQLDEIRNGFTDAMNAEMEKMFATKLGLKSFDAVLVNELIVLMIHSRVDYTIFFRELSNLPNEMTPLAKSFYNESLLDEKLQQKWTVWLEKWKALINTTTPESRAKLSEQMKRINPKYTLREWFLVSAYQQATTGDYTLIRELQEVMTHPYDEQSNEIEEKYYRLKPSEFFEIAGISHISCSS